MKSQNHTWGVFQISLLIISFLCVVGVGLFYVRAYEMVEVAAIANAKESKSKPYDQIRHKWDFEADSAQVVNEYYALVDKNQIETISSKHNSLFIESIFLLFVALFPAVLTFLLHSNAIYKQSLDADNDDGVIIQLGKLNKQAKWGWKLCIAASVVQILFVIYIALTISKDTGRIAMISITLFFFFLFGYLIALSNYNLFTKYPYNLFSRYYRTHFVLSILRKSNLFSELSYQINGYKREFIQSTRLMYVGNDFKSEDFIQGNYNGTKFKFGDVASSTVERSQKSSHVVIHFSGQVAVFTDFHNYKVSDGYLQIVTRKSNNMDRAVISKNNIELENEEFNKRFNVYANKDLNVFYILTPIVMERLLHIADHLKNGLIMTFKDNKLYVGHNSKITIFDPTVFGEDLESWNRQIINDTLIVRTIIDELINK